MGPVFLATYFVHLGLVCSPQSMYLLSWHSFFVLTCFVIIGELVGAFSFVCPSKFLHTVVDVIGADHSEQSNVSLYVIAS